MKLDRMVIIAGIIGIGVISFLFANVKLQPALSINQTAAANSLPVPQQQATDIASLYRLAESSQKEGRLIDAVSAYEKAMGAQPGLAETYLRLGALYFKLDLPSKAQEFYTQAISKGLDNAEIYFHLGYIEEVRGTLDKALEYYIKSEEKGSRNPELFYNIGNACARLDKKAEAIAYYKRVVSMNPGHMDAFVNLSVVSFQMKAYADARFYLDKAIALGYKAPEEYLKVMPP